MRPYLTLPLVLVAACGSVEYSTSTQPTTDPQSLVTTCTPQSPTDTQNQIARYECQFTVTQVPASISWGVSANAQWAASATGYWQAEVRSQSLDKVGWKFASNEVPRIAAADHYRAVDTSNSLFLLVQGAANITDVYFRVEITPEP